MNTFSFSSNLYIDVSSTLKTLLQDLHIRRICIFWINNGWSITKRTFRNPRHPSCLILQQTMGTLGVLFVIWKCVHILYMLWDTQNHLTALDHISWGRFSQCNQDKFMSAMHYLGTSLGCTTSSFWYFSATAPVYVPLQSYSSCTET